MRKVMINMTFIPELLSPKRLKQNVVNKTKAGNDQRSIS